MFQDINQQKKSMFQIKTKKGKLLRKKMKENYAKIETLQMMKKMKSIM